MIPDKKEVQQISLRQQFAQKKTYLPTRSLVASKPVPLTTHTPHSSYNENYSSIGKGQTFGSSQEVASKLAIESFKQNKTATMVLDYKDDYLEIRNGENLVINGYVDNTTIKIIDGSLTIKGDILGNSRIEQIFTNEALNKFNGVTVEGVISNSKIISDGVIKFNKVENDCEITSKGTVFGIDVGNKNTINGSTITIESKLGIENILEATNYINTRAIEHINTLSAALGIYVQGCLFRGVKERKDGKKLELISKGYVIVTGSIQDKGVKIEALGEVYVDKIDPELTPSIIAKGIIMVKTINNATTALLSDSALISSEPSKMAPETLATIVDIKNLEKMKVKSFNQNFITAAKEFITAIAGKDHPSLETLFPNPKGSKEELKASEKQTEKLAFSANDKSPNRNSLITTIKLNPKVVEADKPTLVSTAQGKRNSTLLKTKVDEGTSTNNQKNGNKDNIVITQNPLYAKLASSNESPILNSALLNLEKSDKHKGIVTHLNPLVYDAKLNLNSKARTNNVGFDKFVGKK